MPKIFPSVLSPAARGEDCKQSSTHDDCIIAARPTSPSRSRSAFRWGAPNLSRIYQSNSGLVAEVKKKVEDKLKDLKWNRLQSVIRTNKLLQGVAATQSSFRKIPINVDDETDLLECLEVCAEQQSERMELLNEKILEKESELLSAKTECRKKNALIEGLQQNLTDMKKNLEGRIQRLSGRNEKLLRLYNSKGNQVALLHAKIKEETLLRQSVESQFEQVNEKLKDKEEDVKIQSMHYELLRQKLCEREVELENLYADSLRRENDLIEQMQEFIDESTHRIIQLEHESWVKEENVNLVEGRLMESLEELRKAKEEVTWNQKQRENIKEEAEELGREALRASAEVEVLTRRVNQLEEEIVKGGQLYILPDLQVEVLTRRVNQLEEEIVKGGELYILPDLQADLLSGWNISDCSTFVQ